MLSNLERDFVRTALSQDLRVDQRSTDEPRPVSFEFSEATRGHVIVHVGQTKYQAFH